MLFLTPIIDQTFNGLIWRIEFDQTKNLLLVETRSETDRAASFSAIDLDQQKINFDNKKQPEKWLIGLTGGRQGIMFLHGYSSAQSPEHKGIIAINTVSGEQLWADYNLSLLRFTQTGLLATDARMPNRKPALLDYQTGAVLNAVFTEEKTDPYLFPLITDDQLSEKISDKLPGSITGEIVRLDYNPFIIISLHSQINGALQQHIFILQNQNLVYQDLLNENIQKLQPEAFMMINNYLVYLKNKITLKVLNLKAGI